MDRYNGIETPDDLPEPHDFDYEARRADDDLEPRKPMKPHKPMTHEQLEAVIRDCYVTTPVAVFDEGSLTSQEREWLFADGCLRIGQAS